MPDVVQDWTARKATGFHQEAEMEEHARTISRLGLFGGAAAIIGGMLRIMTSFVPFVPDAPVLELLYAVIDVFLLAGFTAAYLVNSQHLGWGGLISFGVTSAALASIVGPDATMFGVDFYILGSLVFEAGLLMFSVIALVKNRLRIAASFWLASAAMTLILALTGASSIMVLVGVALGAGFVAAGIRLVKDACQTHRR